MCSWSRIYQPNLHVRYPPYLDAAIIASCCEQPGTGRYVSLKHRYGVDVVDCVSLFPKGQELHLNRLRGLILLHFSLGLYIAAKVKRYDL